MIIGKEFKKEEWGQEEKERERVEGMKEKRESAF